MHFKRFINFYNILGLPLNEIALVLAVTKAKSLGNSWKSASVRMKRAKCESSLETLGLRDPKPVADSAHSWLGSINEYDFIEEIILAVSNDVVVNIY